MFVRRNKLTLIFSVVLFLLLTTSSGSVIKEGNIIVLRSQFRSEDIKIDGKLDEINWAKAGSISLQFGSGDNQTSINIKLINDEDYLYLGFVISEDSPTLNSSASIFFDVEADGVLTAPEDGKTFLFNGSTNLMVDDRFYDGTKWDIDKSVDTSSVISALFSNDKSSSYYEIKLNLMSSDLQYDGLRIPDPNDVFIGLNFVITKSIDNVKWFFSYPTISTNSSGFIDTKLAGPEDQDLPEYIPPVVETDDNPDADLVRTEDDVVEVLSVDAPFFLIPTIISFYLMKLIRRRKKND